MEATSPFPHRLYKYRPFDARTVELLVDDQVYFANPATFNDPLDTRPSLDPDLAVEELEAVLEALTTRRISAEMSAAARSILYKGPKTLAHIERHTKREAEKLLREIAFLATDPEFVEEAPGPRVSLLAQHIKGELLRQYDKGVLSLASRYECPLMWSHYGDQHRGLCIGYSIPPKASANLHEVQYGGSRLIKASRVKAMLDGDVAARQEVDAGVLMRKAQDWNYEQEWRLLGARGQTDSPMELEEVVFGVRSLLSVRHTVLRALEGRGRDVKFYLIREDPDTFELKRYELDEEDAAFQPKRSLSVGEVFGDLTQDSEVRPSTDPAAPFPEEPLNRGD